MLAEAPLNRVALIRLHFWASWNPISGRMQRKPFDRGRRKDDTNKRFCAVPFMSSFRDPQSNILHFTRCATLILSIAYGLLLLSKATAHVEYVEHLAYMIKQIYVSQGLSNRRTDLLEF